MLLLFQQESFKWKAINEIEKYGRFKVKISNKYHKRTIRKALSERLLTRPKFSLMFSNEYDLSDWEADNVKYLTHAQDHPRILIKAFGKFVFHREESLAIDNLSDIKGETVIVHSCHPGIYLADYAVTITDWNDPESERPNLCDQDQPLKCLLYFQSSFRNIERCREFISFRERLSHDVPIIGPAHCRDVTYAPVSEQIYRSTQLLTIAFYGHTVQAAALEFNHSHPENWSERLVRFHDSLPFDLDPKQAYICGFLFLYNIDNPCNDFQEHLLAQCYELFPDIHFKGFMPDNRQHYDLDDTDLFPPCFRLLIVHIAGHYHA